MTSKNFFHWIINLCNNFQLKQPYRFEEKWFACILMLWSRDISELSVSYFYTFILDSYYLVLFNNPEHHINAVHKAYLSFPLSVLTELH